MAKDYKPPKNRTIEGELRAVEKRLARNLRTQVQSGLAQVFSEAKCTAVGREIKAGRNVTKNAEFGIRTCIHPKTGPRVDPITLKFSPQSKRGRELDEKIIEKTNLMLETGGFSKMSPTLLSNLRKQDKEFEEEIKARKRERGKK